MDTPTPLPARKLGIVLSGGGARGAFQVGVLERLYEDARFARGAQILSGTSAGAINAALLATGRTPRDLLRFWRGLAANPPVVANDDFFREAVGTALRLAVKEPLHWARRSRDLWKVLRRAWNHVPPRRGSVSAIFLEALLVARFELVRDLLDEVGSVALFDTARLREVLVAELGGDVVKPAPGVSLAINAMDAKTGKVVRFTTGKTRFTRPPEYEIVPGVAVDTVVASASIPLLFPPVRVGEHLLWDGGVLVNTPLAPAVDLGAEEIVTVLVTEPPLPQLEQFPSFGDALERLADSFLENTFNVDRKLLLERNRLAETSGGHYREVRLYEAIRPLVSEIFTAGSYLDFDASMIEAMYHAGRDAAGAWLKAGPPLDRLHERPWADAPDEAA